MGVNNERIEKLELEYEGIRSSISKYTSDGSVINF